ncbi:MAG TPA: hypothetical protein VNJ07_12785 [Chitinophagales bacterium]|nr:hypothetical protein [Chitinophagales bacterium]
MKTKESKFQFRTMLKAAGWTAAVAAFLAAMGASIAETQHKECSNLYIKIDHDTGLFFVDESDVTNTIKSYCSEDLHGMPLRSVDFSEVEERLESNPFVQNAEIFSSTKGALRVDVSQRQPLVRVVNNSGVSYYLDVNGTKIPASSKFTARVVVATGYIENQAHPAVLDELRTLCLFISKEAFWKAQFEQIYVTQSGEFELVPKLGNHIIRLGRANDLEAKFHKLMIFYKEVLKNFDADNYRIVNLKYDKQIVCTKNSL